MGGQKITRKQAFFSVPEKQTFFSKNNHIIHIFLHITGQKLTYFRQNIGSKLCIFCQFFCSPPLKYQMSTPLVQYSVPARTVMKPGRHVLTILWHYSFWLGAFIWYKWGWGWLCIDKKCSLIWNIGKEVYSIGKYLLPEDMKWQLFTTHIGKSSICTHLLYEWMNHIYVPV